MATKTLADRVASLPPGLSPLLSLPQLAAYYGVSTWVIRQWMKRGCPTEPTAGLRGQRFDLDRVKAWVAEADA
jgi:phage terminase Nu1 subunit (DNA packaging protein)